jgi:hypothetical protein
MLVGQRSKQIDIQQTLKRAEVDDVATYEEIRTCLKRLIGSF